jgi:hypothetical protein
MHQACCEFQESGWRSGLSRCSKKAEVARSNRAPERLRRLMIGHLPVEEYGTSLNLVVAASFAGVRQAGLADALARPDPFLGSCHAGSIPVTGANSTGRF